MHSLQRTSQFKRDVKRIKKQGRDLSKIKKIIRILANGEKLPVANKDHALKGTMKDCRECHVEPDWLLIYRIDGSDLWLARTGSHADLFKK